MVFFIIPKFNEFLQRFRHRAAADHAGSSSASRLSARTTGRSSSRRVVGAVVGFMAWWSAPPPGRYAIDRVKLRMPAGRRDRAQLRAEPLHPHAGHAAGRRHPAGHLAGAGGPRGGQRRLRDASCSRSTSKVREGESLWESLDETGLISDITIQMIKVGESTGALVEMLENASDFTDEEIDTQLTRLVSLIEPLMLVFMAVVVATMLLSIYLPLIRAVRRSRRPRAKDETMADEAENPGRADRSSGRGAQRAKRCSPRSCRRSALAAAPRAGVRRSRALRDRPRAVPLDPGRPDVPLQLRAAASDRRPACQSSSPIPTDVLMIDELELLLGTSIEVCVGTQTAIQEILKKSESSQRVLEEATEEFRIQIVTEDEETGEETLTIDRLTSDSSPIIKLVDSTIFNALQRRASDIHIETRDREVVIKYRIDGVLYQAMEPIDKKFHSTIISRIKVMSELDISEKRIPQDGRFKLRDQGPHDRLPRLDHAQRARRGLRDPHPRQGVDERGVQPAQPRRLRLRGARPDAHAALHQGALRHGAGHRADRVGQDHHALRRAVRDPQRRGQDHHDRGPGRVPACRASRRSRSTRRRG